MERRQTRILMWLGRVLLVVVIVWGFNSVQAQTIGKTIDKSNYQEYAALLNPAMLEAVKRGDWTMPTANLDFPYRHWNRFLTGSEKNAGKFDVNEEGDLIDKSTGKIPTYNIYGFPFPKIDPKDPQGAVKIIWNYYFQRFRVMGSKLWTRGMWVGKDGEERYYEGDENYIYFQGRPPGHELKNPKNFRYNEFFHLMDPMSVKGTNSLGYSFMDDREDVVYAYVPAIRRSRQTSAVSRSDPYMGSDGWIDLSQNWSGKNSSMKWKLVGERTILVPFTHTRKEVAEEAPDGTITMNYPVINWGFRVKGWRGAPWAPTNATYVPRQVWVVEQWPKNPYYNWGLHVNYVDKETSVIWLKEIYTKGGEFRTWKIDLYHYQEAPSGNNTVGIVDAQMPLDEKIRHAFPNDRKNHPEFRKIFIPASRLGPDFFTLTPIFAEPIVYNTSPVPGR